MVMSPKAWLLRNDALIIATSIDGTRQCRSTTSARSLVFQSMVNNDEFLDTMGKVPVLCAKTSRSIHNRNLPGLFPNMLCIPWNVVTTEITKPTFYEFHMLRMLG